MHGNWASSQVDLGNRELFHIPSVISVSFQMHEGVLGDCPEFRQQIKALYVFDWEHGTSLQEMKENRVSSLCEGKSHVFSRIAEEPGVYSQVTAGMAFQNLCLFSKVRTPV